MTKKKDTKEMATIRKANNMMTKKASVNIGLKKRRRRKKQKYRKTVVNPLELCLDCESSLADSISSIFCSA